MVSASKTYFPTRYASLPLTLFSRTRAPPLPPLPASPRLWFPFLPRPPTSSACLPPQIVATKRFPVCAPRVPRDYQPARFAFPLIATRASALGLVEKPPVGRGGSSRFSTVFRVGSFHPFVEKEREERVHRKDEETFFFFLGERRGGIFASSRRMRRRGGGVRERDFCGRSRVIVVSRESGKIGG